MWWDDAFKKPIFKRRVFKDVYKEVDYKAQELIKLCAENGMIVDVHQGLRSYATQQKLYNQGRTTPGKRVTRARPGQSWHNFGLAVDIVFKDNGRWSWAEKHPWERLGVLGKQAGFVWGGDFRSITDRPHFQLTGDLTLKEARGLYAIGGLKKVWKNVN